MDVFHRGIVKLRLMGHHARPQRRRRRREVCIDRNILRCGKRAVAPGVRQHLYHAAPVRVPDGPAVEPQGPRAGIVQVVRAVAIPDRILEHERRRAVARDIMRRPGGCPARIQIERWGPAAGALVDGDGPAKVDRDRHDCARVRDRVRAVQVVVRRRYGLDGEERPVDHDILQPAERVARPRRRQRAVDPRIQVVCDRAAPERRSAVAVGVEGRGVAVPHHVHERQLRRAVARHIPSVVARVHPERGQIVGIDVHPCVEHDADADGLSVEVRAVGVGRRDVPHGRRRQRYVEEYHRVAGAPCRGDVHAAVGQGECRHAPVPHTCFAKGNAGGRVRRLE